MKNTHTRKNARKYNDANSNIQKLFKVFLILCQKETSYCLDKWLQCKYDEKNKGCTSRSHTKGMKNKCRCFDQHEYEHVDPVIFKSVLVTMYVVMDIYFLVGGL